MTPGRHAIVTHLGAGDGIGQSGLVIALLERYEQLAWPAYPQYVETFRSIFARQPRVSIYPVPRINSEEWGSPRDATFNRAIESAGLSQERQIRLGIYSGHGIGLDFMKSFYAHAGVEYSARRLSPIPEVWPLVPQIQVRERFLNGRRIFLHDDPARGFVIRRTQISKGFVLSPAAQMNQSILRYAAYLIAADEINCIDSGFFWLADSLPVRGKLFLHKYPRWQRPWDFRYETLHDWEYLDR
jgi:hypothetical protein